MLLNTLNKEGGEKYKNHTFTEEGYKILDSFTKELILLYRKKQQYPLKIGIVLGLPSFNYAQIIATREAHLERIKAYAMLLGKKEFEINVEGTILGFSLDKEVKT